MKKLLCLLLLIGLFGCAGMDLTQTAYPVAPSPLRPYGSDSWTLPDNRPNLNLSGSIAMGGAHPLSVDTDGDGDADFTLATSAPAAANSTGSEGMVYFADDFIYVCIATDTWVRTALTTWP